MFVVHVGVAVFVEFYIKHRMVGIPWLFATSNYLTPEH